MSKIKDLFGAYPALQEFGVLAKSIHPIMTDPSVSRDTKRKTLNDLVNSLSDKAFSNSIVVGQIMKIINMKQEICKDYKDTETQVDGILSWCPRMKEHREVLVKEVGEHRKQYRMKL